jgi:hypothetical protein
VFVVGYDRNVVSDSILNIKQYGDSVTSHQYLEKIVQIVYRIPDPGDDEVEALMDMYLAVSETSDLFDQPARSLVIEQNARNPRRIKRFVNAFVLEYGLDAEWREFGAETLARVLILYLYFPDFAALWKSRSERDPVEHFRRYVKARDSLRKQVPDTATEEWSAVEELFRAHGLALNKSVAHAYLLRQIEQELPEGFPKLAQNSDFLSLLESLGDEDARSRLREKLRRYSPTLLRAPGREEDMRAGVFISYRRDDAAAHASRHTTSWRSVSAAKPSRWMSTRSSQASTSSSRSDARSRMRGSCWWESDKLAHLGRSRGTLPPRRPERLRPAGGEPRPCRPRRSRHPAAGERRIYAEAEELPEDLEPLWRLNALELTDARWERDVERLADVIERAAFPARAPATPEWE